MDLLKTAVVDITTMVAAYRALKSRHDDDGWLPQRRLRRDIKRATLAYIDALASTRRGVVDDRLLNKCRVAAEQQMPRALAQQALLGRFMATEAGCLDGLAATRQDLWRLAHMAICLSSGMATLRHPVTRARAKPADALAGRLRRRLRKALIAYARATLRGKADKGRFIVKAREAALAEIGRHGAAEADRLADFEAGADLTGTVIRQWVTKPLLDLALDWRQHA